MSAPRASYEQMRASKRVHAQIQRQGRRGSFVESETDAESLASFSTYRSNSSPRIPSASSVGSSSRSPLAYDSVSNNPLPRPRTLSRGSASSIPTSPYVSSPSPQSHLSVPGPRARHQRVSTLDSDRYDSPLRRWLRWMSQNELSYWSLPVGVGAVLIVKTAVGFGSYSGRGTPPMYGDFEAQRHWMEVTLHRPIKDWYYYGPDWWQLDYPPLTAYVSYLCGRIGSSLEPAHFALDVSRGIETPNLSAFMRMSVLALELVGWYPAVIAWCIWQGKKAGRSWRSQMTAIMTILLQPGLILIDNGHFQYNSVLLAFTLISVQLLSTSHDLLACIAFVCGLSFKQMGLYYAPAIGGYLLGKCIWLAGSKGLTHLAKLGATTVSTFLIIFAPFLTPFPAGPLKVVERMFPFGRGIFEDKVANFWCASNVVFKWRRYFGVAGMARLALLATLVALIPTLYVLVYSSYKLRQSPPPAKSKNPSISLTNSTLGLSEEEPSTSHSPPTITLLPLALFTSALSFFLFSFQVHEKSILIPLMPLMIMMSERGAGQSRSRRSAGIRRGFSDEAWEWGVLINNVAVFSMWPLLARDGQALQYVAVTFLWNFAIGYSPFAVEDGLVRWMGYISYLAMAAVHLLPLIAAPPARLPDLFIVLNVLVSSAVFGAAWLWGALKLLEGAWALGVLLPKSKMS